MRQFIVNSVGGVTCVWDLVDGAKLPSGVSPSFNRVKNRFIDLVHVVGFLILKWSLYINWGWVESKRTEVYIE